MSTDVSNAITGNCYRIEGRGGNGIMVNMNQTYCIDYNQAALNILGIWEDGKECLKMYAHNPEKNRIGGWQGLVMNASCWDVLSEISKSEHGKASDIERHWFFRGKTV